MTLNLMVFDIFTDTFGNLFTDVLFGVFILVGILLGIFLRPFFGNQVLKLHTKDHRLDELDIDEETAISIECKKRKGMPPQRFFKWQPGFTGIAGRFIKKPKTVYLAAEGTAYTQRMKGGDVRMRLAEAIRTLWGEAFCSTIPQKQAQLLEDSRIGVTVNIAEELTPKGMRTISEEDIKSEEDRKAAETLWEGKEKKDKGQLINLFLAGGTGAAVVFALFMLGILKTPVIVVPAPPVNGTAPNVILTILSYLGA